MITYEIFTENFSVVIQADSMLQALLIFSKKNKDKVIFAEDIEAKRLNRIPKKKQ